jgi:hypothetical protein
MQFILRQQAKFSVGIRELQKRQKVAAAEAEKRADALERGFASLTNFINETVKLQRENTEQIAAMKNATKETDKRLSALIAISERSINKSVKGGTPRAAKKPAAKKPAAKKNQSRK